MKRTFTKISTTAEVVSTEYKSETFSWEIGEFSQRTFPMKSAKFDGAVNEAKWNLILYPDGYRTKNSGYLSLFLHLCTAQSSKVHVLFDIRIINKLSRERSRRIAKALPYTYHLKKRNMMGVGKVIQRSTLLDPSKGFLTDDKLTITCDLTMVVFEPLTQGRGVLSKQMELLLSSEYCDCTLISDDGVEIRASKFLLAAQSDVFRAMFKNETEEAKTGRVEISDCSSEAVREFLHFTCTGKVQKLDKLAAELLFMADKYDVEDLKQLCAESLINLLAEENVCRRLLLADRHDVPSLKMAAFNFISRFKGPIKLLPYATELFSGNHSDLIMELFSFMRPL